MKPQSPIIAACAFSLLILTIWLPVDIAAQIEGDLTDAADIGLQQLPPEVRGRWLSLTSQVDTAAFAEIIYEGRLILRQLGELIQVVGGQPPTPDMPSYSIYSGLENSLTSLLDKIQLALVLQMPDEELQKLLDYYRTEKNELSGGARTERQRLIDAGTALIRSHENDPYFLRYPHRRAVIADLYFRLTELIYEESYDLFLEATDDYLFKLDSLSKVNPGAIATLAKPKPDYTRVMAMYQRIVDEFPTSEYADDALYNLAVLTAEGETQTDRDRANRLLETLIRIYPESVYKLNALRRIGEYYFNPPVNSLEKSIDIYSRIVEEYRDSEYESEALYKLGWCYYRKTQLADAVEYFARSLDASNFNEGAATGSQFGLDIASESINYIGICYAIDPRDWKDAGVDNMVKWLRNHPDRIKNYGRRLITQLGAIYHKQVGRYADAVSVYEKFLELFPLDPQAWRIHRNVVEVFQQGEIYNPQHAYSEKKRFFDAYNIDSQWWSANADQANRDELIPVLENYLNLILDETLVLATDSKDPALYDEFEKYCRQYLRYWPKGYNVYKVHYNLASILERNKNKKFAALKEYWQVAINYADTTNRSIACQRIVAIAQELMKQEKDGFLSVNADGTIGEPLPQPPAAPAAEGEAPVVATSLLNGEALLLSSFDLFLGFFPESPLATQMLYQAGDILFQHNRFVDSRRYLEWLLADYPGNKFTEDAYTLILEGHFKVKEFAAVEEVSKRILAADVSAKLKDNAGRRKAESVFLNASNLKEGADHLAAANEFKRVALESPDYQYADRSLFQAGLEYNLAQSWSAANEVFLLLADRYPKSEFADKALYNAGFNLQSQIKDPATSAMIYERLANGFPTSDLTQGALSNASMNYNQVEDHRSAVRVNELYVKLFPTADDASVYLFENASHYMKLGEIDRANEIYKRFAERYPDDPRTVQAFFERGKYELDKGDRAGAAKEFTSTVDAHQKLVGRELAGAPKYASQALGYLLTWEQQEYEKLRLTVPEAQRAAAKERKKQWRNALVDKMQALIKLGQKEGYRAFHQIGRLDEDFAQATYAVENPTGKTPQAAQEALAKLIDEAILLNIVASQTYRSGYEALTGIIAPLHQEKARRQQEYAAFADAVSLLQKDAAAVGVPDSLTKLTNMQRTLVELDSAIIEAQRWSDSCRLKVPEVAFRNGDYFVRTWRAGFGLRSTDKNEEVRLLFREEVIKNIIAPPTADIIGLYSQALITAREVGLAEKWWQRSEAGYAATLDSLMMQYTEQINFVETRINKFIADYEKVLPKGEDARTPQGFYPDEMGGIILDNIEYYNTFINDFLKAYKLTLDTLAAYKLPYGFGEQTNNRMINFILEKSDRMSACAADAKRRQTEYADKYNETSEIQWDDATVAFEDVASNFSDYNIAILENVFYLRKDYAISGDAGIEVVRRLIASNPDKYASAAGIAAQTVAIATDNQWRVWPQAAEGFQEVDFNDAGWPAAMTSQYPMSVSTHLDNLNAKPIWYFRDKPKPIMKEVPVEPPPTELPAEPPAEQPPTESALEGEAIEILPDMADQPGAGESDTTGSETDTIAGQTETPTETLTSPPQPATRIVEVIPAEEDSIYRLWAAPDENGVRRYWFRRTFNLDDKPTSGRIWITADDNYSLFVNGVYIAEDKKDTIDWSITDEYDIAGNLRVGRNLVAVEASDIDSTHYGLMTGLVYEIVPNLQSQLGSVVDRERQNDRQRKSGITEWTKTGMAVLPSPAPAPEAAPTPVETAAQEQAVSPLEEIPQAAKAPTAEELRDMRIIEKNKLR